MAVSRSMTEQLGTLTSGAALYLLAGALGCLPLAVHAGRRARIPELPRRYLVICGGLFAAYGILLYSALGLCATRRQVLEVTVINYLWPGFTLVLSIPILKHRARVPLLLAGVVLCLAGVCLASGLVNAPTAPGAQARAGAVPHALALGAALAWPLYSNLARLWARDAAGNGVPLFLLATGLLLMAARAAHAEPARWTVPAALEVLYAAVVPMLLGYMLWDIAVRRGNLPLVAALSYATPVLSIVFTSLYLDVPLARAHWAACGLVVGGALCCKLAVRDAAAPPAASPAVAAQVVSRGGGA